jgi:hypothetical protein
MYDSEIAVVDGYVLLKLKIQVYFERLEVHLFGLVQRSLCFADDPQIAAGVRHAPLIAELLADCKRLTLHPLSRIQ